MLTRSLALFEPSGMISPWLRGRPSGLTAHSTYVRYSRPKPVGSSMCSNFASISVRPRFDSTVASPLPLDISTVPPKSILVGPERYW